MKIIEIGKVGQELIDLINDNDPVEEDIGILGKDGSFVGVLIKKDAYDFFIQKVEEEEDLKDSATIKEFHNSGEKN